MHGEKTERRYAKMVVMIKSGVMSDFLVFFTTSVCNFYHRWEKNPLSLLLIHSSKISILSKLREESKNTNKLWVSHQYWILKDWAVWKKVTRLYSLENPIWIFLKSFVLSLYLITISIGVFLISNCSHSTSSQ